MVAPGNAERGAGLADRKPKLDDGVVRLSEGVLSHLDGLLGGPDDEVGLVRSDTTSFGAPLPVQGVADRFELLDRLGHGGMSEVYRARDAVTGREVALKVQHAGEAWLDERFDREVGALATLTHPSLVAYVAHGITREGLRWIATEVLEGESLAARLARGALPPRAALMVARDVLGALAALHARGFVHRDVKPGNVFVDARGRAKLLDLGLLGGAPEANLGMASLTEAGSLLGTVGYLSPEQGRGERHVDAAADVFAIGSVLYECLAGSLPFGRTLAETSAAFAMRASPPLRRLPRVPDAVLAIVVEMLTIDARERPRDAGALAARIGALLDPPIRARVDLLWFDPRAVRGLGQLVVADPSLADRAAVHRAMSRAEASRRDLTAASGGLVLVEGALELGLDARARARAEEAALQGVKGGVPRGALDGLVERALLEGRAFEKKRIFGESVRAELRATDRPPLPVYLPAEAADALPLERAPLVRLIAELHPREDLAETSPIALRCVGVARVVPRRDAAISTSRT